ncbi:MAG: WecB/TagA/CpsF family glycosyltransferase [Deltaproteobacteria bacterium]|nr:WecB/TagA/CpsF family glycosyltransferase [Deltaproteobacteria bacterium]
MTSVQPGAEVDVSVLRFSDESNRPKTLSGGVSNPSPSPGCPSRYVLGMRVDGTSYRETAEVVADLVAAGGGGAVCVSTVHMVMEAFDDPEFRGIVNSADRVTPDGVPLVWALRLLGVEKAERVYGPSLLPMVCDLARERGLSVGFYGGSREVLDELVRRIGKRFPGLDVSFAWAPPYTALSDEEDQKVIDGIEDSGTNILFVGLGCPKQERWIAEHRNALSCVMVGVGAAFDFHAGNKPQAPEWMQIAGLEWLFRLGCEPRRLWRRYLYHNPRFLFHFVRQLAREF